MIPLLVALSVTGCSRTPALETILEQGELRVVMLHGTAPFYEDAAGPGGLENDLAQRFSERLGVELKTIVVDTEAEMVEMLLNHDADIAAAGLAITRERSEQFRFGPAYQSEHSVVVYRVGSRKPENLDDLGDGILKVTAPSGHHELLLNVVQDYTELSWMVAQSTETIDLLQQVNSGELDFTIAYSHELDLYRHQFPELRTAFDLGNTQAFAWALPPGSDDSLAEQINDFFNDLDEDDELVRILDNHFGHLREFDYVDIRAFQRRIDDRLPPFIDLFEQSSGDDIDWRLLAAVSYQESHWKPKARSPTGVRGMMMLTNDTAKQMGVEDRLDPAQSIRGGAAYLRWVRNRLPERITEPDRTWLALATYNIGFGHLEDARILTEQRGGDPDRWTDVREVLPLLQQKAWYKNTKRGYARGKEAVSYVENIRTYHDILVRREYLEGRPVNVQSALLPTFTPLAL